MDCLKCKSSLHAIMARPRPKALLDALEETGIKTLENAPESRRRHHEKEMMMVATSSSKVNPTLAEESGKAGGTTIRTQTRMNSTLNIKCMDCSEEGIAMKARAYMEAPPMSIILCANRLQDRTEMEEALVHELVHVYDHALVKMDLTNCTELAYSEIRAAREAECHYAPQLCSWFKKQCVKNTATRSTSTLFPEEGAGCVTQVFEQAYKDVAPLALHGGLAMGGRKMSTTGVGRGAVKVAKGTATATAASPSSNKSSLSHAPIGRIPTATSLTSATTTTANGSSSERTHIHASPSTSLADILVTAFGTHPPSSSSLQQLQSTHKHTHTHQEQARRHQQSHAPIGHIPLKAFAKRGTEKREGGTSSPPPATGLAEILATALGLK